MITLNLNNEINLSPGTLEEEVSQNIVHLLNTIEGTVPLARGFGLSPRAIDKPLAEAKMIYTQEIYLKIEKYEPRFKIKSIVINDEDIINGRLKPIIKGQLAEE